jgi:hypothetical protein
MQPDPGHEASDPVTPPDLAKPKPRGRGLLRATSAAGLIGCAVLGFLLFQAAEREKALQKALQVELSMWQYQLSAEQTTRRRVEAERKEFSLELRQAESARDSATRSLTSARTALSECQGSLESTVRIARSHRDKLDEIAGAIQIGMIGVTDIPAKRSSFGFGFDAESEYRKVVDDYNDLVRRFNAAIERSNDLGEIVNRVVNILRS